MSLLHYALSLPVVMFLNLAVAAPALAEPTPERQQELLRLMREQCSVCHGPLLKGLVGPPLQPAELKSQSDEELVWRIRSGVPGSQMPQWSNLGVTEDDAGFIVKQLRAGWKG